MTDNKEQTKRSIKPALLVIDVQNKFMATISDRDKELATFFINILIDLFRKHSFPIIRIYHQNKENGPRPGTEEFEYPASVLIKPEDTQIVKSYSDSFNKTNLREVLMENDTNTVFLCGLSAVGCVISSFVGAHNNDYRAFIIKDAIMSHNTDYTRNIEVMFDAISYDAIKLILENSH
jgi:nicotinamidase-related amidase